MMKQSFKDRWGYKGRETALNGLTLWLDKNVPIRGDGQTRQNHYCRQVVEFAIKNIEGFISKGSLQGKAGRAAKLIDKHKMFKDFVNYINQQKEKQ